MLSDQEIAATLKYDSWHLRILIRDKEHQLRLHDGCAECINLGIIADIEQIVSLAKSELARCGEL